MRFPTRNCIWEESYFRNAGVEHDVINNGASEMVFIEIELKDTATGKTL